MIIQFPYKVSRRAYSRKRRCSKNGTPEEREAKAVAAALGPGGELVQLDRFTTEERARIREAQPNESTLLLKCIDRSALPVVLAYLRAITPKN